MFKQVTKERKVLFKFSCPAYFVEFEILRYEGCSKSSKPYPERRAIAKHFYFGKKLPLLMKIKKLISISVLISRQVRPIQR